MRYISAKEYARKKGLSFGYVYQQMKHGKIHWEPVTMEKTLKLIPWDDEKQDICQQELVAQ